MDAVKRQNNERTMYWYCLFFHFAALTFVIPMILFLSVVSAGLFPRGVVGVFRIGRGCGATHGREGGRRGHANDAAGGDATVRKACFTPRISVLVTGVSIC